jgi:uncharacterized Rossmann fold enzyme
MKNKNIVMKFEIWLNYYNKILDDFGFSREDDEKSAILLNKILSENNFYSLDFLKTYIDESTDEKTIFIVFGAGPSIKKHIKKFKELLNNSKSFENFFIISADGATTALLEDGIIPDVVVSDLDGKMEDLLSANEKGSIFVIHAHGNNYDLIKEYGNIFNKSIGTTQSKPFGKLYNFGGFTDGDRAVFLAVELFAKKILLAGFDFGNYVSKYSRPNITKDIEVADDIKRKKLKYAKELIDWIVLNEDVDIQYID